MTWEGLVHTLVRVLAGTNDRELSVVERMVLVTIAIHWNRERGDSYPGRKLIGDVVGRSERQVHRIVLGLKDKGWIEIGYERVGGRWERAVYSFTSRVLEQSQPSDTHMSLGQAGNAPSPPGVISGATECHSEPHRVTQGPPPSDTPSDAKVSPEPREPLEKPSTEEPAEHRPDGRVGLNGEGQQQQGPVEEEWEDEQLERELAALSPAGRQLAEKLMGRIDA